MLGRKEAKQSSNKQRGTAKRNLAPSVLGEDLNILGNLISDGYIDINGHIEGNVKCDSLTIRENGMVRGDIFATTVQVHGEVNGIIKAKNIHLAATARVKGVIIHEALSIENGAQIDGQCKRSDRHTSTEGPTLTKSEHTDPKLEVIENIRVITGSKA